MTRESLPQFDLYGELEVSPGASAGTIEAAYRSLVKRHHPDVSASADSERIKRLNLAREWLTDPERRRRYDAIRRPSGRNRRPAPVSRSSTRQSTGETTGDASSPSFGPNADAVRQFLAELRGLDLYRARQLWDGHAVAHAQGYGRARRAAATVGRAERRESWLFAREAASVIARGKLGDGTLTEQVLGVVADTAGALAIRDLIPPRDFILLLTPWTWRGEPVDGVAARRAKTASRAAPAAPATSADRASRRSSRPGLEAATGGEREGAIEPAPSGEAAVQAAKPSQPRKPHPRRPAAPPAPPAMSRAAPPASGAPAAPPPPGKASPLLVEPEIRTSARPVVPATFHVGEVSKVEEPAGPVAPAAPPEPGSARVFGETSVSTFGVSPWQLPPAGQAAEEARPRSRSRAVPPGGGAAIAVAHANSGSARLRRLVPVAVLAVAVIAAGLLGALGPPSEQQVAGMTDAPTPFLTQAVVAPPPTDTAAASAGAPPSDSTAPTAPPDQPGPSQGEPTPAVNVGVTPRPPAPAATPRPSPRRTPAPTPVAPTPTPSPAQPSCTVPDLLGVQTAVAPQHWTDAGFSGAITFDPPVPPQYRIGWQSLTAGTRVACTSGITVRSEP